MVDNGVLLSVLLVNFYNCELELLILIEMCY